MIDPLSENKPMDEQAKPAEAPPVPGDAHLKPPETPHITAQTPPAAPEIQQKPPDAPPVPADAQPKPADAPPMPALAQAKSAEAQPKSAEAPGAVKPMRRAGVVARKSASDSTVLSKPPAAPDTAKTIAFAVCGLLALGIVGLGGYLALRPKTVTQVKTPMEHLSGDARTLAEKATTAKALYEEGKLKAGSSVLADLRDADEKLTEANRLFNEIADQNQTVEGFKDQIDLAREKKLSIDKELLVIRKKIDEMESEERRNKSKTAEGTKPSDANPAAPAPAPAPGKEPAEAELSDANLDRLFKDDPSEYERLAKIRKAKDPKYEIKKE